MRLLIGILLLTFSCSQKTDDDRLSQNVDSAENKIKIYGTFDTLTLSQFDKLFRREELVVYDLATNADLKTDLDKGLRFWDSKRILIGDTLRQLDIQGFPISLRQIDQSIRRITTVTESENQLKILVFTLDNKLRTIDRDILTFTGGDEGISSKGLGKFLNDSLYTCKVQVTKFDSDEIERETNYCLKFHTNGTIERIENCR